MMVRLSLRVVLWLALATALWSVSGCGRSDNKALEKARAANTEQGYLEYLKTFPNGTHRAEAKRAAEEAAWRAANGKQDSSALRHFLDSYPSSTRIPDAQQQLQALVMKEAEKVSITIRDLFFRGREAVPVKVIPGQGVASRGEWFLVFRENMVGASARVEMEDGSRLTMTVKQTKTPIGRNEPESGAERVRQKLVTEAPFGGDPCANLSFQLAGGIFTVRKLPNGFLAATCLSKQAYNGRFSLALAVPNPHRVDLNGAMFPCVTLRFLEGALSRLDRRAVKLTRQPMGLMPVSKESRFLIAFKAPGKEVLVPTDLTAQTDSADQYILGYTEKWSLEPEDVGAATYVAFP